jgi:DNA-binding beta-propeller fold protein YncE
VLSQDERYLYTPNYFQTYISRIDLRQGNRREDLAVGGRWAAGIAITPDRRKLVVPLGQDGPVENKENDQLAIVDIADGRFALLGQVPLKDEPTWYKIGFSADSRFAYVTMARLWSPTAVLHEVRLTPPYKITHSLPFPNAELGGVAVSAKQGRVFVADKAQRKVWLVDRKAWKTVVAFDLADYPPESLALNREETVLAAVCPGKQTLVCLKPEDGTVLAKVPRLREGIKDAEFSADGRYLLVTCHDAKGSVAVLSAGLLPYEIVFSSNRGGEGYQVFVMNAAGGQAVRLTRGPNDLSPRWSPDGQRIAVISDRRGPLRICIIDRQGRELAVLEKTDPVLGNSSMGVPLDWSPDGKRIAFVAGNHKAIRVVNVVSGRVEALVEGKLHAEYPDYTTHHGLCWRKSDGMILVNSQHPQTSHQQDVFLLDPNAKGGRPRRLTDGQKEGVELHAPAASPDGKRIALVRAAIAPPTQCEHTLALMGADGTGGTTLVRGGKETLANPRWSSDGKCLVYVAEKAGFRHVCVVYADGNDPIPLTTGTWNDADPDIFGGLPTGPAPP